MGAVLRDKKNDISSSWLHLGLLISSFGLLSILTNYGTISLAENRYPNPFFLLAASFLGWIFVFEISYFLEKTNVFKKIFACLGGSTLPILILHFLCFKIVSYAGVLYEGKPLCLVALFPVLYDEGLWWIAYTLVGLIIPVFLHKLWKLSIKKFLRKPKSIG